MTDLSQNGYSHDEIIEILQARDGVWRGTYKLFLTRQNTPYKELDFTQANIECNDDNSVKYIGTFSFRYESDIDWNKDRLQLYMEWRHKGATFSWPLCPPLVMVTPDEIRNPDYTSRGPYSEMEIGAYDESIFLRDNSLDNNYFFPSGTSYRQVIEFLLGKANFTLYNIVPTSKGLPTDRELEQGEKLLETINTLCQEINYRGLEQHKSGIIIARPYESIYAIEPRIKYYGDHRSLVDPHDINVGYDNFNKPNFFIGYVDNSDLPAQMRYEFPNESPTDIFSIPNRGYVVTDDPIHFENVADYETLQSLVLKRYEEVSTSYETVSLKTAVMPHHEISDLVAVDNIIISGIYLETYWRINVSVSESGQETSEMEHVLRSLHSVNK